MLPSLNIQSFLGYSKFDNFVMERGILWRGTCLVCYSTCVSLRHTGVLVPSIMPVIMIPVCLRWFPGKYREIEGWWGGPVIPASIYAIFIGSMNDRGWLEIARWLHSCLNPCCCWPRPTTIYAVFMGSMFDWEWLEIGQCSVRRCLLTGCSLDDTDVSWKYQSQ